MALKTKGLKDFKHHEQDLNGEELVFISQNDLTRKATLNEFKEYIAGDNGDQIEDLTSNKSDLDIPYLQKNDAGQIYYTRVSRESDSEDDTEDVIVLTEEDIPKSIIIRTDKDLFDSIRNVLHTSRLFIDVQNNETYLYNGTAFVRLVTNPTFDEVDPPLPDGVGEQLTQYLTALIDTMKETKEQLAKNTADIEEMKEQNFVTYDGEETGSVDGYEEI